MIIKSCQLSLSAALFVAAAGAQTLSGPTADSRQLQSTRAYVGSVAGHQLQPTQQQVDSREDNAARQRDHAVQAEIDRLYDEITRAAARGR